MTNKEKSIIQENLVKLYLRLNGYFTTGFIVHSQKPYKIQSEIDILAVRFPFHIQNDTGHNSSPTLKLTDGIDIIIAEVKSHGQSLKFNKSLYENHSNESWTKILNWTGLFKNPAQINELSIKLQNIVKPVANSQLKDFRSIIATSEFGKISIRPILFSPERINPNNADKFINWTEINDFIWYCLAPISIRELCATTYDFTAWGENLNGIVKLYKDRAKKNDKYKNIEELYNEFEILKAAANNA